MSPPTTSHVTPQVAQLIAALRGEMGRADLMDALGVRDRPHFAHAVLKQEEEPVPRQRTWGKGCTPLPPRSPNIRSSCAGSNPSRRLGR